MTLPLSWICEKNEIIIIDIEKFEEGKMCVLNIIQHNFVEDFWDLLKRLRNRIWIFFVQYKLRLFFLNDKYYFPSYNRLSEFKNSC